MCFVKEDEKSQETVLQKKKEKSKFNKEKLKFFILPATIFFCIFIEFSLLIFLNKKFDITLNKDYVYYLTFSTIILSWLFARAFDQFLSFEEKKEKAPEIKEQDDQKVTSNMFLTCMKSCVKKVRQYAL